MLVASAHTPSASARRGWLERHAALNAPVLRRLLDSPLDRPVNAALTQASGLANSNAR